jgi:vitamin B12 transporter
MSAALDRATLTLGSTHERIQGDLSYASESEFGPRDATARYGRSTSAVYLEALVEAAPSLQATFGVRTDHNDAFGRFDTYRAGFSWNALPATRVRGAIGRAFREPTFGENFGSGFGDLGNEELVPERTRSWEAGIERVAGPFTIAGTWFAQTFRDLIQFTFATSDPADPNYFNVGTAESSGVELAAEGSLGSLKLSGEYTFLATQVVDPGLATDATFVQGEPLLRRPRHSGGLSARVAHARGSVSIGATLVGRRADVDFGAATAENDFVAPRVTLPGYGTLDLSAEALLPFAERIAPRLLLRVENILDAEYEGIRGFPAPGRIVRVGASVEVGG